MKIVNETFCDALALERDATLVIAGLRYFAIAQTEGAIQRLDTMANST